jgi:hypothetical protein
MTYVYKGMPENTCKTCFDYYYTVDSVLCLPQPYPVKVSNYNNRYLILEFSQPVKYSPASVDPNKLITISISGDLPS